MVVRTELVVSWPNVLTSDTESGTEQKDTVFDTREHSNAAKGKPCEVTRS